MGRVKLRFGVGGGGGGDAREGNILIGTSFSWLLEFPESLLRAKTDSRDSVISHQVVLSLYLKRVQ